MSNPLTVSNRPIQAIVTQRVTASAERVFAAWLDPNKIHGFMFGSHLREEEVVAIEVDPQVGGRYTFSVRRQGQQIDHVGEYLEIDRPQRLVFTWGVAQDNSSSRVAIDIVPLAEGCALTLTHDLDPAWADYVAQSRQGWQKMVDTLDVLLGKENAA